MVDWNKEISFGRKRDKAAETIDQVPLTPEPENAEKTSVWKKEIRLGRKKAETPPAAEPFAQPKPVAQATPLEPARPVEQVKPPERPAPVQPAPSTVRAAEPVVAPVEAEKTSVWKKEIKLGKKKADKPAEFEAPVVAPALPPAAARPQPAPLVGAPVVALEVAKAEKTSVWKKEIKLGKKKADKPAEFEAPVVAPALPPAAARPQPAPLAVAPLVALEVAKAEKTSVWKKEIKLGKKKAEKPAEVAAASRPAAPVADVAATAAAPGQAAQDDVVKTSVWKKEISLKRKPKADAPVEAVAPAVAPQAAPRPVPARPAQAPPAPVQSQRSPAAGRPPQPAPPGQVPAAARGPVPGSPTGGPQQPVRVSEGQPARPAGPPRPGEPAAAPGARPPAAGRPTAAPGSRPPAAAGQRPAALGARLAGAPPATPGTPRPAASPQPRPAGAPGRRPAAGSGARPTQPPAGPGAPPARPARPQPPAEPAVAPAAAASAPSASFWKKEIALSSLVRKKSADQPPGEPPAAAEAESTSIWKKEIGFRKSQKGAGGLPAGVEATEFEPSPAVLGSVPTAIPDEMPPAEPMGAAEAANLANQGAVEVELPAKSSSWKPSLKLRRGAAAATVASATTIDEMPSAEQITLAKKRVPVWKRDLSLKTGLRSSGRADKPQKRHKKVVGLKVGASQLAAARIQNNGSPEIVQLVRDSLERGVVVSGEVRDTEALAAALKSFFRRHHLPRRNVRLGISNNRIGVRIIDLAGIDDPRQLDNAIRFRAQEALPIDIAETVLDYRVLDERIDEEGMVIRRILLVVAYRELIDRYLMACRKAGVKLVGIDLEGFAILRALAMPRVAPPTPDSPALVAVSIGFDRSTLAVSDGQVCEFTRVLGWGGSTIDGAIARVLNLTPVQAEWVKRSVPLEEEGTTLPKGITEEQAAQVRDAVRRQLQTFARELVSSLHFYQNQPGSLSIGEVVLTGGTAHMPGLAAELQRLIGVQVRLGDPLARAKSVKKLRNPDEIGSLAVAIGLGIED